VRTTLDLPDALYRRLKLRVAKERSWSSITRRRASAGRPPPKGRSRGGLTTRARPCSY